MQGNVHNPTAFMKRGLDPSCRTCTSAQATTLSSLLRLMTDED